ncbi:HD domain-containing protein [Luteibaculum oceani]|uniref:HD domain-containing protein n=1 Tax=Luteibaculum oceani TaxID=1294296 RepID=UPI0029391E30|nr:HD domain-containing protein [Luteibaculum oceani]
MRNTYTSKVFNDPVYGFINIPDRLSLEIIDHPHFQRLRRIKQLGLTHLVYPGAINTRFHHALGAMHLMNEALKVLLAKGHKISDLDRRAASMAILLHDIGHGPFSHALEHSIVQGITHEHLSLLFMEFFKERDPELFETALKIFKNEHPLPFLHQLVSGQLDMDRMDYLMRDSFYTGVSEGVIGSQRIIKMLDLHENQLVVEEKGIYSVEKFLVARRIMYWQVYLHKTVVAAEFMLVKVLSRAKELYRNGIKPDCTPALKLFLENDFKLEDFVADPKLLNQFAKLDDYDIHAAIKTWQDCDDYVLRDLSTRMVNRKLFRIVIRKHPFNTTEKEFIKQELKSKLSISEAELEYYLLTGTLENNAYLAKGSGIMIKRKNGSLEKAEQVADNLNLSALAKPVKKYFMAFPKEIDDSFITQI